MFASRNLFIAMALLLSSSISHAAEPTSVFKFKDAGDEAGLYPAVAEIAGMVVAGAISTAMAGPIYMSARSAACLTRARAISCLSIATASS
jgi:hypothetical protein